MVVPAALLLLVTLTVTLSPPLADPTSLAAARAFHVRSLDAQVQRWIAIGASQSRTFTNILDRLAASDVIVYVQVVDSIPAGVTGQLRFVASKETVRYLRIDLASGGTTADMVALLGHELQHAVEIAETPRVKDSQAMATLYLHLGGLHANGGKYDSLAARIVGERIRAELSAYRG
jgi:hypothetical protein